MSEHFGRYRHFSSFLADKGVSVYGFDLRGHGLTGEEAGTPGFLAEENGWNLAVEDIDLWIERVRRENPGLPVFLLGHSMGSFLARAYAGRYGEKLSGLILSGTGRDPGLAARIGRAIALIEAQINGKRAPSALLDRLSFGPYARSVKNRSTRFDWLSRDERQVDMYIADPLCGRIPTTGFFADLLKGIREVQQPTLVRRTPRGLPIYLFSGSRDPVGGFSRGVAWVYREYRKAGVANLSLKIYSDGRHEMLNETNRDEVYRDVLAWIVSRLPSGKPDEAEAPAAP
jgi:alpha-beta hydrolase superfamily lysophospholipase